MQLSHYDIETIHALLEKGYTHTVVVPISYLPHAWQVVPFMSDAEAEGYLDELEEEELNVAAMMELRETAEELYETKFRDGKIRYLIEREILL